MATERVGLNIEVDEELEMDFFRFSMTVYPRNCRKDTLPCTWYLDSDKRLANIPGQHEAGAIWIRHLNKFFFHPRAIGMETFSFMGASRRHFWKIADERLNGYVSWIERMCETCDDPKLIRMAKAIKYAVLQEYYAESLHREQKRGGRREA